MTTLCVVLGVFLVLITISRIRRGFRKYKAALNCLMAKQMFTQANNDLKSAVHFRSWRILLRMGFSDPPGSLERMSEVERCSVFALAFAELEIPPPFKDEEWQFVRRPFVDLLRADIAFAAARRHLKSKYGVDLTF
jgi:hypothetical protein